MQVVNHGTVCWFEEESPAWNSDGSLKRVNGRYCVWREDSKAALLLSLYVIQRNSYRIWFFPVFLNNKSFATINNF